MPRFAASIVNAAVVALSLVTTAAVANAQQKPGETDSPPVVSTINERLRPFIDNREIAGAVTLVATPDRIVHLDAIGKADIGEGKANAARHHLLDRVDDQAHHRRGRPHAPG